MNSSSLLWKKKVTQPEVQLPERDAKVLGRYTARVKTFDEMFKLCCCWVGYDVLLGNCISFGSSHCTMLIDSAHRVYPYCG